MAVAVKLNPDKEIVKTVKEGRMERTPQYKCMCDEFKAQIKDPDFEGYCHCMLYYKSKENIS